MTSGRWLALGILGITAIFGLAFWWFLTRAYYEPASMDDLAVMNASGETFPLEPAVFDGVETWTSPISYRACFTLDTAGIETAKQGTSYAEPTPLTAPGWFDCFDAVAIAEALVSGEAQAILGTREIHRGVDRVVALFPDGRAYAWHQLNGTLD